MDKWKDIELEKMKVGGNRNARVFFEAQPDWDDKMTIQQKYNTKAAALYRDKVWKWINFIVNEFLVGIAVDFNFSTRKVVGWEEVTRSKL